MSRVSYSLENNVATVTMDDGKVNVMSCEMLAELGAAFDRAQSDEAMLVLRSTRPVFSAGFDLKVFAANDAARSLAMVKAGAELALRLLSYPLPTIGVMQGHAFPMGTFLLLGCDVRIGVCNARMGLNEVAIGIAPPGFAVELARSRLHPAWLSRTVTLGEMYEGADAVTAGFLDRAVAQGEVDTVLREVIAGLCTLHAPSHALAKQRLRRAAVAAIRQAIDDELTPAAYNSASRVPGALVLPGALA